MSSEQEPSSENTPIGGWDIPISEDKKKSWAEHDTWDPDAGNPALLVEYDRQTDGSSPQDPWEAPFGIRHYFLGYLIVMLENTMIAHLRTVPKENLGNWSFEETPDQSSIADKDLRDLIKVTGTSSSRFRPEDPNCDKSSWRALQCAENARHDFEHRKVSSVSGVEAAITLPGLLAKHRRETFDESPKDAMALPDSLERERLRPQMIEPYLLEIERRGAQIGETWRFIRDGSKKIEEAKVRQRAHTIAAAKDFLESNFPETTPKAEGRRDLQFWNIIHAKPPNIEEAKRALKAAYISAVCRTFENDLELEGPMQRSVKQRFESVAFPNQDGKMTTHGLQNRIRRVLSESCFKYALRSDPELIIKKGWTVPEQVEMIDWRELQPPTNSGFSSTEFRSMLGKAVDVRNAAAHHHFYNEEKAHELVALVHDAIQLAIMLGERDNAVEIELLAEQYYSNRPRIDCVKRLQNYYRRHGWNLLSKPSEQKRINAIATKVLLDPDLEIRPRMAMPNTLHGRLPGEGTRGFSDSTAELTIGGLEVQPISSVSSPDNGKRRPTSPRNKGKERPSVDESAMLAVPGDYPQSEDSSSQSASEEATRLEADMVKGKVESLNPKYGNDSDFPQVESSSQSRVAPAIATKAPEAVFIGPEAQVDDESDVEEKWPKPPVDSKSHEIARHGGWEATREEHPLSWSPSMCSSLKAKPLRVTWEKKKTPEEVSEEYEKEKKTCRKKCPVHCIKAETAETQTIPEPGLEEPQESSTEDGEEEDRSSRGNGENTDNQELLEHDVNTTNPGPIDDWEKSDGGDLPTGPTFDTHDDVADDDDRTAEESEDQHGQGEDTEPPGDGNDDPPLIEMPETRAEDPKAAAEDGADPAEV